MIDKDKNIYQQIDNAINQLQSIERQNWSELDEKWSVPVEVIDMVCSK